MAPHHPSLVNHPSHPKHPLSLVSSAPYPEGIFNCDACNRSDKGFCYHCKECNFDLHIHCASLPLSLNHNSHPQHPLKLTFVIPYPSKDFSCDICKNIGSKCWIYRCNSCAFDAHLDCATSSASIQRSVSVQTPQSQPMFQHQFSLPVDNQQTYPNPMLQNHNSFPRTTQAWTKPTPTGYNFATNQQPNYYPMNNYHPTFVAPALRVPALGVQQTNQQPNYYAMNNNQPTFGAPAMGVHRTNFQNQPGNNPSIGGLLAQGFCEGMGQQAGQTIMQSMLGWAPSLGGGNVDASSGGNVDASSGCFVGAEDSSSNFGEMFSM